MPDPYYDKFYIIMNGDVVVANFPVRTHYVEFPHANMVIVYANGLPARLELALAQGEWTTVSVMEAI